MELSLVTPRISLQPQIPGEVLIDVVNTEDVIDALTVELAGIPGAVVHLDAVPTLFPGERRRLPLRVELPAQVPAGRHELEVRIEATAGGQHRRAVLVVDVWPKPGLATGVHPSVRRAVRRADFPLTVANRGNTGLVARPREVDVPDPVQVSFDPAEFTVPPWETRTCTVRVLSRPHLAGTDHDQELDLRIAAWSATPGHPLLEEEISQDLRITFRQRPVLSPGVVFAVGLVLVLIVWGGLGYAGLRAFVRAEAPSLAAADDFFPAPDVAGKVGAAITVSGQVVSGVDDGPMAGVTVLACSQDPLIRPSTAPAVRVPAVRAPVVAATGNEPACTASTATASAVSDGTGWFRLLGTFPGPYRLRFVPTGTGAVSLPGNWFDASCRLYQRMPSRPGTLRLAVAQPPGADREGTVRVEARVVAAPTASSTAPAATTEAPTPSGTRGAVVAIFAADVPACPRATAPQPRPTHTPDVSATTTPAPLSGSAADRRPTKSWRAVAGSVIAADGTLTALVTLPGLPAPGRYDLTISAGTAATLTLRAVPVDPDGGDARLRVTLRPAPSGGPSPTVAASP